MSLAFPEAAVHVIMSCHAEHRLLRWRRAYGYEKGNIYANSDSVVSSESFANEYLSQINRAIVFKLQRTSIDCCCYLATYESHIR